MIPAILAVSNTSPFGDPPSLKALKALELMVIVETARAIRFVIALSLTSTIPLICFVLRPITFSSTIVC